MAKKDKGGAKAAEKQKKPISRGTSIGIMVAMFLAGLAVFLYPVVSEKINENYAYMETRVYETEVNNIPKETLDAEWIRAVDYNNSLQGNPVKDPFIPGSGRALPQNYLDVLNVGGIMATVEIPKIDVNLPIYHGTSDEVLKKGVGHMEGTALPIGSSGGHAVLTGHTGLPTAKLFTDLTKLEEGDRFYLHVLGRELVYEIDQIKIIDPKDVSDLVAAGDKDYVTLITCYPYGVNSHRLLVRGVRVHTMSKTIGILASAGIKYWVALIAGPLIILLILLLVAREKYKQSKKKRQAAGMPPQTGRRPRRPTGARQALG